MHCCLISSHSRTAAPQTPANFGTCARGSATCWAASTRNGGYRAHGPDTQAAPAGRCALGAFGDASQRVVKLYSGLKLSDIDRLLVNCLAAFVRRRYGLDDE